MSNRQRFQETMHYGRPDRPPYFEEGIREEVVKVWRQQGLAADADLATLFPSDPTEYIEPDFDPLPAFERWPSSRAELAELEKRLDPADAARLPENWAEQVHALQHRRHGAHAPGAPGFLPVCGCHGLGSLRRRHARAHRRSRLRTPADGHLRRGQRQPGGTNPGGGEHRRSGLQRADWRQRGSTDLAQDV